MIIYEVVYVEKEDWKVLNGIRDYAYFSNGVKARSFVSKKKKDIKIGYVKKHDIPNSKTSVLNFLNRRVTL